ncbi:MAG: polyisoprenoid-binding protein [Alphaproteobacteria bacterium]|nr:polyisoprenoid-binding protein [Alphaproteobacteria bacterium]
MARFATLLAAISLSTLPAFAASHQSASAPPPVPAGVYTIDKAHTSLVFKVNHLGFSHYTAQFTTIDARLNFDPNKPEASSITATVDPRSLLLPTPPAGFLNQLLGKDWLNVIVFPQIAFRSTKVERTGKNTARITGELSLHGVKRPILLEATYNGGYAGHPMDPHARIGFSAHGSFKRSDFGIAFGIPAPGTTMGVGDGVDVTIETELNGPPLATAAK